MHKDRKIQTLKTQILGPAGCALCTQPAGKNNTHARMEWEFLEWRGQVVIKPLYHIHPLHLNNSLHLELMASYTMPYQHLCTEPLHILTNKNTGLTQETMYDIINPLLKMNALLIIWKGLLSVLDKCFAVCSLLKEDDDPKAGLDWLFSCFHM